VDSLHPLVDVDLVELVLRIPPELSFDPLNRPLLREAVSGVLPEPVRRRARKSTFDAPFRAGLIEFDLPVAQRLLSQRHPALREYIDVAGAYTALLERSENRNEWGWRVWRLLMAECWLRSLEDPDFPRRLREAEQFPPAKLEIVRG
jgi:asparagine synthase (glutamine-hydrolysing)